MRPMSAEVGLPWFGPKPPVKVVEKVEIRKVEIVKQAERPKEVPKAIFVEPGRAKSIKELQQHNKHVDHVRSNPPPGIPMNPKGTPPGQPQWESPTPKNKAESLQNAQSLLGSKV